MSIDRRALSTIAFFPEGAYGPTDDCAGKPMELLLADTALARRLEVISRRLRAAPGTVTAADAIERVAAAAAPA